MATIILSYRREDTELMVGRICDRLRDHFGRDSVMMDIDSIPYGLDFRKHIKETLKRCDLVLAVIGPRWAALNEAGQSRLADETDWIRIEIEAALAKDVPVIPVLVNGASMPKPKDLPETMQDLAFRQAAPLDMRRDFHAHMDRLIGVIGPASRGRRRPGNWHWRFCSSDGTRTIVCGEIDRTADTAKPCGNDAKERRSKHRSR